MQLINYIPNQRRLALPRRVAKQVIHNLVEPFFNLKEAKAFYKECPTSIVIFNRTCNTAIPDEWLNDITTHFIKQAIENPEHKYDLADEYEMMLTITSDAGNGLYVIKPKELKISFK
ncbi:hypothetical protein A9Q98_06275 [Thalassotalea sp. 42_200_T64]|nr:hypothetical protein A9Q98_06275 [Thalassotalea sp. 42_200_T64]